MPEGQQRNVRQGFILNHLPLCPQAFNDFIDFDGIPVKDCIGNQAARARGCLGGRPRKMDITTLPMAMTAMRDPKASPKGVAQKLGITTATLYTYVNTLQFSFKKRLLGDVQL